MNGSLLLYNLKLNCLIIFLPVWTAHWLYLYENIIL